jgi:hypothetical protein
MMAEKKPTYEELKHRLDTAMLKASSLTAETDQQAFITQTFVGIHDRLTAKQVNHEQYLKTDKPPGRLQGPGPTTTT